MSSIVEEAENRISHLEDKAPMIEDNHAEIEILKAENASMKKVLQMDECSKRRNNFVINGLEGKDCKMKEAEMIFQDLCENKLKLGREWAQTVVINKIYRFPPKDRSLNSWPMFMSLNTLSKKDDIYQAAHNLRDTGIFLRNDLAPHLREEKKNLIKESIRLRAAPHNLDTRLRDAWNKVWLVYKKAGEEKWQIWEGQKSLL